MTPAPGDGAGLEPGAAESEIAPEPGWIASEVSDEFPELALFSVELAARLGNSTEGTIERLRQLSSRFRGSHAVTMRTSAVPAAYRIFFRHIGLDPDATRTPIEEAALARLMHGGFQASNLLDDALLIALVETGVPVWALDAATVDGPLGIRVSTDDEALGRADGARALARGRLVVADAAAPLALLFGELAEGHRVTPATARVSLFSVRVAGVPEIHIEEALWTSGSILREEL